MDDLEVARVDLARRREAGEPFAVAWPAALAALPPIPGVGKSAQDRAHALRALAETRDEWERAYLFQPAPARPRRPLHLDLAA